MTEIKEIKKETATRKEFKTPSIDTPPEERSVIAEVNSLLSQYNTKIRTSKTIEITGAGRLKLANLGSVPTTCLVGEMIVSGGKLYICSALNTFTIVGTQT